MTKQDKVTTEGGNRAYDMIRSKISKGKDGYGKVVTTARERLMERLGKDPGEDTVAMHKTGGSHFGKGKDQDSKWGSRGENTADSNRARAKKLRKKIMED